MSRNSFNSSDGNSSLILTRRLGGHAQRHRENEEQQEPSSDKQDEQQQQQQPFELPRLAELSRGNAKSTIELDALVHADRDNRLRCRLLHDFLLPDCLVYPFEVHLLLPEPRQSDLAWNLKHDIYLTIMYSQVHRFFFPYNRHNSQLFVITNEEKSSEMLMCVNVPSRMRLDYMNFDLLLANCRLLAAVSSFKDHLAFFRLKDGLQEHQYKTDVLEQPCEKPISIKSQGEQWPYENFCYVPPVRAKPLRYPGGSQ